MLTLFIILPMLIAAFAALLMRSRPKLIKYVALAGSLVSLGLIILAYMNGGAQQSITWFSFSGYQFPITTSTMPLNMLLLLIVGIMTPLIIIYSMGFMKIPSEQRRYYFELCMFVCAMLLFAMSADFITMFIGWEFLGVTSYLLIGFWQQRDGTADAARKAITTILIGDIMMLFAMFIIWNSYHTFSFAALLQQAGAPNAMMPIALIFIIAAVFTKSAQFPFQEWLPDAMKGPTPVSAFLHSSTMVKAGVFLIAVLLPLFVAYHMLYLLLIFGLISAILGAVNALTEFHIKRVLAYSTIEDLGLMFVALGTGSVIAAMMLFLVQTFYKALVFMSAGSMIMANNYEEDMRKMYNSASHISLFVPTLIGAASLAGLFPLSGFFGKAAVEMSVGNVGVYLLLILIGFASNLYIFRWLFIPLRQKTDKKTYRSTGNYRTLPKSMMLAIYLLLALVLVASAAYIYLPAYLGTSANEKLVPSYIEIAISIATFIIALAITYKLFYKGSFSLNQDGILYKLLYNSTFVNAFYIYVTKFFALVSRAIEEIDYSVYRIVKEGGTAVNKFGNMLKKLENGDTNTYVAALVIGLIIILAIFIL